MSPPAMAYVVSIFFTAFDNTDFVVVVIVSVACRMDILHCTQHPRKVAMKWWPPCWQLVLMSMRRIKWVFRRSVCLFVLVGVVPSPLCGVSFGSWWTAICRLQWWLQHWLLLGDPLLMQSSVRRAAGRVGWFGSGVFLLCFDNCSNFSVYCPLGWHSSLFRDGT